jgi:hypothetical protein
MGFWKGLVDKVAQKKEELEEEAKKRAAKKATEMAIGTGKAAAKAAVKNAGRTLDYAGKKLEEAIFGSASSDDDDARSSSGSPGSRGSAGATRKPEKGPDPFAKLKAEEARAKTEREVDDELAALKKKIRGP